VELFGLVLLQPTTCLTNLILAVECWFLAGWLRNRGTGEEVSGTAWEVLVRLDRGSRSPRFWSRFFLYTGLASLLGIPKHGLAELLSGPPLTVVIFGSSLASGFGVMFAEWATLRRWVRSPRLRRWLLFASAGKVGAFAGFLASSHTMTPVIVNTALGLIPVMVVEGVAGLRGNRGGRWVAGGLAVSALGAPVHLLELGFHTWFSHDDLAHVFMMVALAMIYRGVAGGTGPDHPVSDPHDSPD
jgi:hypothetical protein